MSILQQTAHFEGHICPYTRFRETILLQFRTKTSLLPKGKPAATLCPLKSPHAANRAEGAGRSRGDQKATGSQGPEWRNSRGGAEAPPLEAGGHRGGRTGIRTVRPSGCPGLPYEFQAQLEFPHGRSLTGDGSEGLEVCQIGCGKPEVGVIGEVEGFEA